MCLYNYYDKIDMGKMLRVPIARHYNESNRKVICWDKMHLRKNCIIL